MTDNRLELDGRRIVCHPIVGYQEQMRTVTISFDGRPVEAREGETVGAALLATGIRVFRIMPRTGEARGGYCFVGRCSDCLMVIEGEPNVMACLTRVHDGMRVATQRGLGTWVTNEVSS